MSTGKNIVYYEDLSAIVGATVLSVEADEDWASLKFADGRVLRFRLEGDCCSSSYFTAPKEQFGELVGARIHEIEERQQFPDDKNDIEKYPQEGGDISWHFLVFTTDKGHVTIDWRNDSNGYYDGSIHPELDWA